MTEEATIREGRSKAVHTETRTPSHTASPPALRQRTSSSDCQSSKIKNYHERNIEHIKALKDKQALISAQHEEEKKKLDLTRERLARIILKRSEALKKAKEEAKIEEMKIQDNVIQEEPEEDLENEKENSKKSSVSAYYRSRYASLLKTLHENNKNKLQQRELEEQKKEKIKQKLKEEMGLGNITSKLFVPTVSSLVASNTITEIEIAELKGSKYATGIQLPKSNRKSLQTKPPEEEEKEKKKNGREAAEKIKKRAQDHLVQLADKKESEARREIEAKIKVEKLKASLRETVLARSKNSDVSRDEIKDDIAELSDSSDSPVAKKPKKLDENAMKRLSQAPKRWNAPIITDITVFRKKYKLTEKDKIFIILGGYPAMRRALLHRSIPYLGRLVRKS